MIDSKAATLQQNKIAASFGEKRTISIQRASAQNKVLATRSMRQHKRGLTATFKATDRGFL